MEDRALKTKCGNLVWEHKCWTQPHICQYFKKNNDFLDGIHVSFAVFDCRYIVIGVVMV
jgi:hypothetical protein